MKGFTIPLIVFCLILQWSISQPYVSSRFDQDDTETIGKSEATIGLVPRDQSGGTSGDLLVRIFYVSFGEKTDPSNSVTMPVFMDLNQSVNFIPQDAYNKKGIDCHSITGCEVITYQQMMCQTQDNVKDLVPIHSMCTQAQSYVKMFSGFILQTTSNHHMHYQANYPLAEDSQLETERLVLDFNLINMPLIVGDSVGVLGMAPNSDFVAWVMRGFGKDEIYISYRHTWRTGNDLYMWGLGDDPERAAIVLNKQIQLEKVDPERPQVFFDLSDGNKSWSVMGAVIAMDCQSGPKMDVVGNLCVSNSVKNSAFFSITNHFLYDKLLDYFRSGCNTDFSKCTAENFNYGVVSDVKIIIYDTKELSTIDQESSDIAKHTISIRPVDQIYFDEDTGARLGFDLLTNEMIIGQGCPLETEIILGNAFLGQNELVMKVGKLRTQIAFRRLDQPGSHNIIVLFITGISFSVLTLLLTIWYLSYYREEVMICNDKKSKVEYSKYTESSSGDAKIVKNLKKVGELPADASEGSTVGQSEGLPMVTGLNKGRKKLVKSQQA